MDYLVQTRSWSAGYFGSRQRHGIGSRRLRGVLPGLLSGGLGLAWFGVVRHLRAVGIDSFGDRPRTPESETEGAQFEGVSVEFSHL